MAKTKRNAGKRAMAAGRDGPRARKSGVPKTRKPGTRKPKPTKPAPRKRKPSLPSETARLKRRLKTARMQQQASAEILRAVLNASGDAALPLQQIAEITARLFGAPSVSIQLADGGEFTQEYRVGAIAQRIGSAYPRSNIRVGGPNMPGTVVFENRQIHIPDLDHLDPSMSDWPGLPHARAGGSRTLCGTPLRREGKAIGALMIFRDRLLPFTDDELALQQSFADQAVIAIENARLFNETKDALERQTATADILRVIATSPSDVQPVFKAIAERSKRLVNALSTTVFRLSDDVMHLEAFTPTNSEADTSLQAMFPAPLSTFSWAESVRRGEIFRVADTEDELDTLRDVARLRGFRSMLLVPLVRNGMPIGLISVTRVEPGPFANHHVHMLQTFADQALIAIENARLFDEVQTRTRDLAESLEQQTATSEVLSVISSSVGDLVPVFDAMLGKAMQLCGADFGVLNTFDGELFHTAATYRLPPAYDEYRRSQPLEYGPGTAPARLLQGEPIVEIPDLRESDAYRRGEPNRRALVDLGGARSILAVPLLKNDQVVGNVMIFRQEPARFSEKQISLLKQFAAQAVIAIENTRLLRELRASTEDLRESLQQQTATADVLKVISRSAFDLNAVFQTVAESSVRLCGADRAFIFRFDGELLRMAVAFNSSPEFTEWVAQHPIRPGQHSGSARAALERRTTHIPDVLSDPNYSYGAKDVETIRTVLGVPILKGDDLLGVMMIYRLEVRPFTDKQIALVETFADQAAIAIENVRLFEQVRERTRELTQSLDDLRTAQDRLVQTEKLASLGQLTAGIAHEIKNPLNFVNNFSAVSAELTDELSDVLKPAELDKKIREEVDELTRLLRDNLEKVVQHGKRADSIVKNMLQHSREGSGEHRPADINAIVDESLNLAYHSARAEKAGFSIVLQRDLDPSVGMADIYPQEITRVLLNLISNSFYATTKRKAEASDGFEPMVSAATKNLGDKVEIRVRDNGTGIPEEAREKIFDPFFTTKPSGEGTGLGLSMSHDIVVKQHGGSIDVETEPGVFTEFRIVLPRTSQR